VKKALGGIGRGSVGGPTRLSRDHLVTCIGDPAQGGLLLSALTQRVNELTRTRAEKYSSLTEEDLQQKALEAAKDAQLSPQENMLLWAALFADDEGRRLLAATILLEMDDQKMAMYNCHLASLQGEPWLAQYGNMLEQLPVPLFPAIEGFNALNAKLMREFAEFRAESHATGGGPKRATPSFSRDSVL
jgi:hypothetical protein